MSVFRSPNIKGGIYVKLDNVASKTILELNPQFQICKLEDGKVIVELQKAIHGLKESSLKFYKYLTKAKDNSHTHLPYVVKTKFKLKETNYKFCLVLIKQNLEMDFIQQLFIHMMVYMINN